MNVFKILSISGALICASLVISTTAQAAPVVIYSGITATRIDGVVVRGQSYNVFFLNDYTDTTFSGDLFAVGQAIQQIVDALNLTPVAFVSSAGIGVINNFVVGDRTDGGRTVTARNGVGRWEDRGNIFAIDSDTRFVAQVPEPATVALLSAALLGLALVRSSRVI